MKRTALVLLIVGIVLTAGAALFCSTPEFAVVRARYAIEYHSLEQFEQAVDVDKVAQNAVKDLISEPLTSAAGDGEFGQWLSNNLAGWLQTNLGETIKEDIRQAVASGAMPEISVKSGNETILDSTSDSLGFSDYHYSGMLRSMRQEGPNISKVTMLFENPGKPNLLVQVELSRAQGDWFWKISRLSNLPDVIDDLSSQEFGEAGKSVKDVIDGIKRGISQGIKETLEQLN